MICSWLHFQLYCDQLLETFWWLSIQEMDSNLFLLLNFWSVGEIAKKKRMWYDFSVKWTHNFGGVCSLKWAFIFRIQRKSRHENMPTQHSYGGTSNLNSLNWLNATLWYTNLYFFLDFIVWLMWHARLYAMHSPRKSVQKFKFYIFRSFALYFAKRSLNCTIRITFDYLKPFNITSDMLFFFYHRRSRRHRCCCWCLSWICDRMCVMWERKNCDRGIKNKYIHRSY